MAPSSHHVYCPRYPQPQAVAQAAKPIFIVRSQTPHFIVSYDAVLGNDGITAADSILQHCEADFQNLLKDFSGVTPGGLPFRIRLTTENGGASHATCAATELFIGANSGGGPLDLEFMRQLVIAEEDEVFMDAFGHGWDCGASNGEGLSRVLANDMTPGAEPPDFISSNAWLNGGRPDWVNNTDPTDREYVSIGCSVLFLNWMRFQLGHSWKDIIAAGAAKLSDTYASLTGQQNGFDRFSAFMDAKFPAGTATALMTDNPFPL